MEYLKILGLLIQLALGKGNFDVNFIGGYPVDCRLTEGGHEYAGQIAVSRSGRTCQAWNTNSPQRNNYINKHEFFPEKNTTLARNFCRNPENDYDEGVWCYVPSGWSRLRWELCDVPLCEKECKLRDDGRDYLGETSETSSGDQCLSWEDDDGGHSYTDEMFLDDDMHDAENFCRNPDGSQPNGPWCYTSFGTTPAWAYCDIQPCNITLINFGVELVSSTQKETTILDTTSQSPPTTFTSPSAFSVSESLTSPATVSESLTSPATVSESLTPPRESSALIISGTFTTAPPATELPESTSTTRRYPTSPEYLTITAKIMSSPVVTPGSEEAETTTETESYTSKEAATVYYSSPSTKGEDESKRQTFADQGQRGFPTIDANDDAPPSTIEGLLWKIVVAGVLVLASLIGVCLVVKWKIKRREVHLPNKTAAKNIENTAV